MLCIVVADINRFKQSSFNPSAAQPWESLSFSLSLPPSLFLSLSLYVPPLSLPPSLVVSPPSISLLLLLFLSLSLNPSSSLSVTPPLSLTHNHKHTSQKNDKQHNAPHTHT